MVKVGMKIRILRPCAMGLVPKGAIGEVTEICPNRIPAMGNDMLVVFAGLGHATDPMKGTLRLNVSSWQGHYEEVK